MSNSSEYTVFLYDNLRGPERHFRNALPARSQAEALQHSLEMYADHLVEEEGGEDADYRGAIDRLVNGFDGKAQVFAGRHDTLAAARSSGKLLFEGHPHTIGT